MSWKGLACSAAMAALAFSSVALADDTAGGPNLFDETTAPSTAPASAPSGPTSLTPLMYLMDPTPVGKWLENNKFDITGFGEMGYFVDLNDDRANSDSPTFVGFPGAYSNHLLLDQADLTLSKSIDSTKSWDWGFTLETGYGTDDAYTHSHGMLDNAPAGTPGIAFGPGAGPQNQWDILQGNVSLLIPLGSGLTIEAGKFLAFLGNEVINPTGNLFYSHSYNFTYGIMYTNTGITGSYTFSKLMWGNDLTIDAGVTRGWNQSTSDNNGAIDFLGQAKFNVTSAISMVLNLEEGPEATDDNSDYWTAIEAIPSWTVSDQLTLTGDFLYVDCAARARSGGDRAVVRRGFVRQLQVQSDVRVQRSRRVVSRSGRIHDGSAGEL